jgi:biopolymer transport protein ExbB/TolQ
MSTEYVEFPTHERPRTDIAFWKVALVGLGMTALILFAAYLAKGSFIREMIMGRDHIDKERFILQGMTIFLWCLSASNVILKNIRVGAERRAMTDDLLPQTVDMTNTDQMLEAYNRIKSHPKLTKRLGVTRVLRVLAMWINTRDFERSAQYAKEEGEIDIFAADSSFRMNRLFIWAMPLIGFIGTVYGVSYGIGGFADFLKGAVTSQGIKEQVGLITQGLAVAFYCTLLGLATAGMAAFPSLAAERKEESVLEHINEYVEDRLISKFPSVKKTEFPVQQIVAMREGIERIKINFPADELVAAMRGIKLDINLEPMVKAMQGLNINFPVEDMAKAIDQGFKRMPNPDRYEQVFTTAIDKASGLVTGKYEEFAKAYENRIGELGAKLAQQLEGISKTFNSGTVQTAQQIAQHTQEVLSVGRGQTDRLQDVVASLEKSTADYAQRVQSSTLELSKQLENITKLGKEIEKVLHVTQSMEAMMSEVTGSEDFKKTLAGLQSHLRSTDDLMKQLSRPRTVVLEETIG